MISTGIDFLWGPPFISFLLLIVGLHFVFNQPKNMNTPTGINLPISTNAKLNADTWKEFHSYSGKIMVIIASICFSISLLSNYFLQIDEFPSNKLEGLNLALMVIVMMIIALTTFVLTENHMNKTFDKKGNRKKS